MEHDQAQESMIPRKASDVLLELELKIDVLLNLVRTQDLNIKILSNKLNVMLERQVVLPIQVQENKQQNQMKVEALGSMKIEAVDTRDTTRQILVDPEKQIQMTDSPDGFRRTSRPETYTQPQLQPQKIKVKEPEIKMPAQKQLKDSQVQEVKFIEASEKPKIDSSEQTNSVPVIQRVTDKNGKSVFLADVEIFNIGNMEVVHKTRTNGAGKWMSTLPVGEYKIFIRKRESTSKEKLEVVQNIIIDGAKSPFEIPVIVIK